MDSGYAHARFRELLYQHGHGYPFWVPEPNDALPTEQKVEGVRIGDVGILTDDGGFEYLWNVHLPADHPYNKSRVPPNFEPLPALNELFDVRKIKNFYPENTAISSANVTALPELNGAARYRSTAKRPKLLSYNLNNHCTDFNKRIRNRIALMSSIERCSWFAKI